MRRKRLVALVDCSAFYCSCERHFRPDLERRPVVVLSNNDGCIIARTQEAKDLGFQMGAPYFQVERELKQRGVAVFSSNYTLYHDMSMRVQSVLERFSPDVERYSIDEAFLELQADPEQPEAERTRLYELAREIRRSVYQATKIPVRVSIAETKTLAKAASEYARAELREGRVPCVCFWGHHARDAWLSRLPVEDVWGVGRRWSKKLRERGADNALSLSQLPEKWVRQHFNVVMERTVLELRGLSCIPLELAPPPRKSLVRSRMFGEAQTDIAPIRKAVATHAAAAAKKLREQRLTAGFLEVFVSTGRHARLIRRGVATSSLGGQTSDTIRLVRAAERLLERAYLDRHASGELFRYKKAGVMLSDITTAGTTQTTLFAPQTPERPELMRALDQINERFGRHSLTVAMQGTPDSLRLIDSARARCGWGMKREQMSPRYTTQWDELPRVWV